MRLYRILLAFILIVPHCLVAQTNEVPINIISDYNLYLNNPAYLAGSSRSVIPVQLPENTVRWYYTVSAYRNEKDVENTRKQFSLIGELSRFYDQTGATASIISALTAPEGSDFCDVYLLGSYNDVQLFNNKADYLGKSFHYYPNGTAVHVKSCKQGISDNNLISGTQYLGVVNPTWGYGVNVDLQVVAIVSNQKTASSGWSVEQKEAFYKNTWNIVFGLKGITSEQADKVTLCIVTKVIAQYVPSDIENMADFEKQSAMEKILKECAEE